MIQWFAKHFGYNGELYCVTVQYLDELCRYESTSPADLGRLSMDIDRCMPQGSIFEVFSSEIDNRFSVVVFSPDFYNNER